jgi:hypothetical protein
MLDLSLNVGISDESLHCCSPGDTAAGAVLTEPSAHGGFLLIGETKPLEPILFRAERLEEAFVLVKLVLELPVVALDDGDLFVSQTGNPSDDLVVGAPALEVRNQVVNCNPAGGELEASATIDESDLLLHRVPSARALGTSIYANRSLPSRNEPPTVREAG